MGSLLEAAVVADTEAQFNYTQAALIAQEEAGALARTVLADPRATEDCMFWDIVVPNNIFEGAGATDGAPVILRQNTSALNTADSVLQKLT